MDSKPITYIEIIAEAQLDECGDYEEFTSDSLYVLPFIKTAHLLDNGLPAIGAVIQPGQIIVAKFGKTKQFDPHALPSKMELIVANEFSLIEKYANMFIDGSIYADNVTFGEIVEAEMIESVPQRVKIRLAKS
jgi:hypothetical protein